MSKSYATKGRTFAATSEHKKRKFNRAKAQSGAFAEAVLDAVEQKRRYAANDNTITDEERGWLLAEAHREERRAKRQTRCAALRKFEVIWLDNITFEERIAGAYACNVPTCETCNESRARMLLIRLMAAHARALEQVPGTQILELVLTQPAQSIELLGDQIDKLHDAVRALLRTNAFKRAFIGSFRRTEVTFNPAANTAHAHAHLVMYAWPDYSRRSPLYLHQTTIKQLWADILGVDGFVNVHIKKLTRADAPEGVNRSLMHAAKYILKPAEIFTAQVLTEGEDTPRYTMDPAIAQAFAKGLFRKRMHAFAGVLKSNWKRPKRR